MKELKTRKPLKERCPGKDCNSSQIHYRKLIGDWKCQRCKLVFKKPKKDKAWQDANL